MKPLHDHMTVAYKLSYPEKGKVGYCAHCCYLMTEKEYKNADFCPDCNWEFYEKEDLDK